MKAAVLFWILVKVTGPTAETMIDFKDAGHFTNQQKCREAGLEWARHQMTENFGTWSCLGPYRGLRRRP